MITYETETTRLEVDEPTDPEDLVATAIHIVTLLESDGYIERTDDIRLALENDTQ